MIRKEIDSSYLNNFSNLTNSRVFIFLKYFLFFCVCNENCCIEKRENERSWKLFLVVASCSSHWKTPRRSPQFFVNSIMSSWSANRKNWHKPFHKNQVLWHDLFKRRRWNKLFLSGHDDHTFFNDQNHTICAQTENNSSSRHKNIQLYICSTSIQFSYQNNSCVHRSTKFHVLPILNYHHNVILFLSSTKKFPKQTFFHFFSK